MAAPGEGLRVVLVDDNPDDRALTIRQLQREFGSLQCVEVTNASELQAALADGDFDVLVTDYQLRWTDGLAVLRQAKVRWPERPVVMFTNSATQEVAVAAMKSGLNDNVVKSPMHFMRLPVALRSALQLSQARQAAAAALRAREEFLDLAAHEMRTPLAGLTLSLQLALRHLDAALATPGRD